jgi:hypothetical protein
MKSWSTLPAGSLDKLLNYLFADRRNRHVLFQCILVCKGRKTQAQCYAYKYLVLGGLDIKKLLGETGVVYGDDRVKEWIRTLKPFR